MDPVGRRLERAGFAPTAVDLEPPGGRADISTYGQQVADAAADMLPAGAGSIDCVGMSMGSVVLRYWIQRLEGWHSVGTFVSLAGPHAGTLTAHFSHRPAARDLRPGSPLLTDLASDLDPWRGVKVHAFYTPLDLMVVPGRSGRLPQAENRSFAVVAHNLMATNGAVLDGVVNALEAGNERAGEEV